MLVKTNENGGTAKRINYRKIKRMLFFAMLVAWPIFQFSLCYVYVNINSFALAFKHYEIPQGTLGFNITFAGMDNFKEAIEIISARAYMFKTSFLNFFWTVLIGLTLALTFSYYIYKKYPMSDLFRVVLFLPKILSGVVFSLLFKYLSNDVYKYVVEVILESGPTLGLMDNPETKLAAVLFYNVWVGFGVNVLMFTGSMSGIDESIVESAHLDGVNTVQEFIYITFPMIWPTFTSFFTIHVAAFFTDQMALHTMFGAQGHDIATFGYYLYVTTASAELIQVNATTPSFGVLSAMGLLMTAVMLPLVLTLRKVLKKYGPSVD